jgi:general secretion pathway protein F
MPSYAYTGLDAKGKSVKGVSMADNVAALKASLRREGVYLTAVKEAKGSGGGGGGGGGVSDAGSRDIQFGRLFNRIKPQEVSDVTRLLATLLRAGVTLPESLKTLTDQVEHERFKEILSDIATKVNEGSALADSIAHYPKVFPKLYVNMIRAGEASGALETVLLRLADFLDNQIEMRSKISKALLYPVILSIVGAIIVAILMVGVVPNITAMFEDMNAELPWNTKLLIFVSDTLSSIWGVVLVFAIMGGIWAFFRWRDTESGRKISDAFILKVPLVGTLARRVAISRFARTLSTLLSSGVQLLEALDIVRALLGNVILEEVIAKARDNIREGEGIAPALRHSGHFPPLVIHMIAVGERSGQLEQMLMHLADAYDRETSKTIDSLTKALEPLVIVFMGITVGFVVFSIMQPIMMMTEMAGSQ